MRALRFAVALLLLPGASAGAQQLSVPEPPLPQMPAAETAIETAAPPQLPPPVPVRAATTAVRLKDIASIQGEASVPLIGYGLVVGLSKTGDKKQTIFPAQTLASMLQQFGQTVPAAALKVENIAAVLVTAQLGPYAQGGSRIDVTAASAGDAKSLQGGQLMPTALRGPDGTVMALAQGALSIGGFGAGGGGNSVQVNHLTVGHVPSGGLVQVSRSAGFGPADLVRLALREPDFVSAKRVAAALNQELGAGTARVADAGAVTIRVPAEYRTEVPELIARIEPLQVELDVVARVVINERTGTVVLGGDVRLGPAAVGHGKLSVRIATQYDVSQPAPWSLGKTQVVPQTQVEVEEAGPQVTTLEPGATLGDVVRALNVLGATPRDIIVIMQLLKAAGALRAELIIV
jgi:flagellar P-ring protein precursor FlgI